MHQTYLDNASTSFPKPPCVPQAVYRYMCDCGSNIGRGGYDAAYSAEELVFETRERLCALFGAQDARCAVFTPNITASLNLLIKGFLKPGDHVLVSSMEHNAVMRPLVQLGVEFDRVPCDGEGRMDLAAIKPLLRPNTRLFVLNHASNVCGTVQDAEAVGKLCKLHGIPLVLDASQSAGHLPIDFSAWQLSALALPAHKGLLGPQGIGALLVTPAFAAGLSPLIAGGTGSVSDSEELPPYLPDRFESGTPNLPGIYGWAAALDYVNQIGIDALRAHELRLTERFLRGLDETDDVRMVGTRRTEQRVGVVAVDFLRQDNAEAADRLEREFGILTRCGMHCAPAAHKTLGTFPRGVVRFSVGYSTTEAEIDAALSAIRTIA